MTKHQRKTEQMHRRIVKLFNELDEQDIPRTVMWAEMSARTGYTREGIQRVLRVNGIDYTTKTKRKKDDGNDDQC